MNAPMYGPNIPTYYQSFGSALRTCIIQKYATFSGRATRSEYWFNYLAQFLLGGLLLGIATIFSDGNPLKLLMNMGFFFVLTFLLCLAFFLPNLAVLVRRLHDTGKSGWFVFINFVPFVGPLILFVFTVMGSQPHDNQYGQAPRHRNQ